MRKELRTRFAFIFLPYFRRKCVWVQILIRIYFSGKEREQMARKYKRLVFSDRQQIEEMRNNGNTEKEIAAAVGVHIATIYRELERGATDEKSGYSAEVAQRVIG